MQPLNVLIACEMSGNVRNEFRKLGHNAWSCDIEPCMDNSVYHYQGDIHDILDNPSEHPTWDLMIAFPPCTFLCSSGLHWNKRRPERQHQTDEALEFVRYLLNINIPHIALENPIGCISTQIRPPDQKIQPFEYGHPESKTTCLWLKNLPQLQPTNILQKPSCGYWDNQTPSGQNKLGPSKNRSTIRSITYPGIACAMATQWSNYILNTKSK